MSHAVSYLYSVSYLSFSCNTHIIYGSSKSAQLNHKAQEEHKLLVDIRHNTYFQCLCLMLECLAPIPAILMPILGCNLSSLN